MRNLKRALSLTLASVMLLGMMVVGAGAAGFPDVADDNDNVEAIEVLQAIEVMVGNADTGNFEPDRSVTRTEMAVVMANLLKLDYKYYEASCPFWDVPTWARPYVGACYANKIVSGYGDGTYGALDAINPVQAASMMMRALGYFQYSEDYKDGFETATVRQGTQIGIFEGIGSSADKDMTRGQVARMALNALESEMVTFTGTPGSTYTASTGESITVGYVAKYEPRTSTELKYKAIESRTSDASLDSNHRGQYYVQLGEELYDGKLVKSYDRDVFMRPSINWQYKGAEIGTYVDYELKKAEYLTGVKYSKLYGDLTYTTINNNDIDRYVDGALQADETKDNFYRANDETVKGTGTGALTEVFLDERNDLITITTINTYLAQANSDYNKTSESLSLKVFDKRGGTTKVVDADVVPQVANVQKDDYKLVYMSFKDRANGEVVSMYDVEIMAEAEISKFSIDGSGTYDKVVKKLTTGGTEYDTNVKAYYDGGNVLDEYNSQLLSDMSYNIYMDRYDNVIGVDLHEGAKNYVFITGYDRGVSHISTKTADAAAIFTDGTMDVITVNVTDTNKNIDGLRTGSESKSYDQYDVWSGDGKIAENRWYTYTVNASGTYTLRPVKNFMFSAFDDAGITYGDTIRTLNTANLFLKDGAPSSVSYDNKGNIYGNDDSIYLTVEAGRVDKSDKVDGTGATPETNPLPGSDDKVNDAIVDIVGRYTGAQDVKIDLKADVKQEVNEIKTTAEKDAYVYSIFDNNYYIIASVVLGEAQGAAANYVYVLDGVQNERVEHGKDAKSASDDTYYWEFKAVVDGEETTLTVKEKYDNTLNSLKNILKVHTIQEIRFDGEYVTAIKDVALKDTFTNPSSEQTLEDMKIYDIGNEYGQTWTVNNADGNGFVHNNNYGRPNTALDTSDPNAGLYNGVRVEGNRIEVVGRTLYTNRDRGDVGLALANNAKAVVVQPVNGSIKVTNCGSVSEAVGMLADRNPGTSDKEFKGRVAAALDSAGAAKWVVIISDTNLVTGDRPNYDYDGKTYTLTLRDCLSNYNTTNYERAHVFMRANNTGTWEPVDAKGTGVYSDVYEILSGYQVRVVDRDIDRTGRIIGHLANNSETAIPGGISEYITRNEVQFVMPSANVELKEQAAYTYNFGSFEIDLNQPISNPLADESLVEVWGIGERTLLRAADYRAKMDVKAITYGYEGGELVVNVTWAYPTADGNEYAVKDTYTTVTIATNAQGRDEKAAAVECEKGDAFAAEASTAELPGTVVLVGTVDADGNVTVPGMTSTENADAKDYGFVIVDNADKLLATGEIEEKDGKDTISVTVDEESGIVEGDKITIGDTELTVDKDGNASADTETPDPDDKTISGTVDVTVPALGVVGADLPAIADKNINFAVVSASWGTATKVEATNTLTITVTPDEGAEFAEDFKVTVNGVDATMGADKTTWTITLPAGSEEPKPDESGLIIAPTENVENSLDVQWYSATSGALLTDAAVKADIEARLKAYLGSGVATVTFNGSNQAVVVNSDFTTKTYTIAPTRVYKVTLNDEFLAYIESAAGAKVTVADKTQKYIEGDKAAAALTLTGTNGDEIALASKSADVSLYTAVEISADGTNLQMNNGSITIVELDERGDKTYTNLNTDKFVKVGATLRIRPADGSDKWSYVTMNDEKVIADVWDTELIPDYTYTVSADDADETGKITFTQVLGTKFTFNGIDLGIIGGDNMEAEFAPVAGKAYDNATLVAMAGKKVADVGSNDVVTVTYVPAKEDGTAAKYTIDFSSATTVLAATADATTKAVELSQVAKVTATGDGTLKYTVGADTVTAASAGTNKWVVVGTELAVESVGATTANDSAKVLKAQIKELGKTEGTATEIDGETNKVGENNEQAKATLTINETYETVKITFA